MKKILALILILFSITTYSQNNVKQDINNLKNHIKKIDNLNATQQQKIVELEEIKTIKDAYQNKVETINKTIKDAKEREDSFLTFIQWFFGILEQP